MASGKERDSSSEIRGEPPLSTHQVSCDAAPGYGGMQGPQIYILHDQRSPHGGHVIAAGRPRRPRRQPREARPRMQGAPGRECPLVKPNATVVNQGLCASAAAGYKSCDYSLTEFKRRGLGLPMTADT